MYKVIRFIFDKELNNDIGKLYPTSLEAKKAGERWQNDRKVKPEIKKGRWFEISETV